MIFSNPVPSAWIYHLKRRAFPTQKTIAYIQEIETDFALLLCVYSFRGGSSPKIMGVIAPSAPSSPSPFSPFSETEKKNELHMGLHFKSIISRVANSVMGWTLRPVETRQGWGSWQGAASPFLSAKGSGWAV